ncbi:hypothetical protein GTQ43_37060 [Nostoc sp. KVJ3]|uniref:hypothetical protein n=1 Tax=Nostoc sp. KVJ3 TaxID=457945 RepID=UPI002237E6F2|nr:hypothetical protein [Nostoc sp. KVJ3]MCW5319046.1 hypothetical protein [Nostoc sp. KVJ3]
MHQSNLTANRRNALRLREDYDAVKAGVTMSVSNGQVVGHINRLKMLKRQMYGRAKIDLLERRFCWLFKQKNFEDFHLTYELQKSVYLQVCCRTWGVRFFSPEKMSGQQHSLLLTKGFFGLLESTVR